MATGIDILILDSESAAPVDRCVGPAADGSCPRVAIGDILPCAGHALVPGSAAGGQPYAVPGQMTLCPVTLALSLAVASDTPLLPE